MKRIQILIVGAGPVGTTAAFMLARAGLDVVLIEAADCCREDLRASTFHAATLEMMSELGVVDEMHNVGLVAPVYQYRDRQSHECFNFDLSELSSVTHFPYRLQCEQWKLSRIMVDQLTPMANVEILFGHRLVEVAATGNSVRARVACPDSKIEDFEADYLIGADGADSRVRKALDISFEGFTYPEKFLTLSTDYPIENHFDDLALVNYISDPAEWMVVLRVPELWRVQVAIPLDSEDDWLTSDRNKDAIFGRLLGADIPIETTHRTIYRVHQRVAKRYVQGRAILVGDAAHLNNPLGGLGMNSGIHDVWNLVPKLKEVIQNPGQAATLLSLYERQRQTTMRNFIQTQTIRNKKFMDSGDQESRAQMLDEMREILRDDERRCDYLMTQSMLKSRIEEAEIA